MAEQVDQGIDVDFRRVGVCSRCGTSVWMSCKELKGERGAYCPRCKEEKVFLSDDSHYRVDVTFLQRDGIIFLPGDHQLEYAEVWKCEDCDHEVVLTYFWLATDGQPVCTMCDSEMERTNKAVFLLTHKQR